MHNDEFRHAFEQAAGTWTGCDWPTRFGITGLNLSGCTADKAKAMAAAAGDVAEAEAWRAAAEWLAQVERAAEQAEICAATALAAANAGDLEEALEHAQRACVLEEDTGRPAHRGACPTWQRLRQAIEKARGADKAAPQTTAAGLLLSMERVLAFLEVVQTDLRLLNRRVDRLERETHATQPG